MGKEKNEEEHQCVIMDYENPDHAIAQIELSRKMKYALKVLHIDNTKSSMTTKVIYPFFEKTMSEWLNELESHNGKERYDKWMKTAVMPKIGELWKLLHEMKREKIKIQIRGEGVDDQGHYMPLIKKEPKLLNFRDGEFVARKDSGEDKFLPRLLNLEGGNFDGTYATSVLENEVIRDEAGDFSDKLLSARKFWERQITKDEEKKEITAFDYWLCNKHPIFYNPANKERFLLLINNMIFRHGLKGWVNREDSEWVNFQGRINGAPNKSVYKKILHYKAGQGLRPTSIKGKLEDSLHYAASSDIVRFTRNALMHFEENYNKVNKNATWHRGLDDRGREIVEILDDELDVCSLHYAIARIIIAENPPEKYTEEGWKKYQKETWENLRQPSSEANTIKVISQAYQPAQLELRDASGNWMEAKEIVEDHRPIKRLFTDPPDCWMEALTKEDLKLNWMKFEEIGKKPKANELPLELLTKEDSKLGWLEFEEIEKKAKANKPLEVLIDQPNSWMTVIQIRAAKRLKLLTKEDSKMDWMKFEEIQNKVAANETLELLTKEDSKLEWMKFEEVEKGTESHPPLKVLTDKDNNWMEPTNILKYPTPVRFYTKKGWKLSWMELEEIKTYATQPLELHIREEARKPVWRKLEEIQNEANQQLELCMGVSSWMKATEISQVDDQRQLSLWKKEASREDNWKNLKDITSEAKHSSLEVLTRVSSWMKAKEISFEVCPLLMDLRTKDGWKVLEEIKNEANQQPELRTKEGWKKLEEIRNEANQQPDLWTRVSSWMEKKKVEEIENDPNQEVELWTMKEEWKQAEEIINADQPPSLWVRKGQDKRWWMEAFEADRPAAEFLTKKNWLNARAELENFFNSLR